MRSRRFAAEKETAARFARFREQYLEKRGADCGTWQPVASRVAGLEQLLAELHMQRAGEGQTEGAAGDFVPMVLSQSHVSSPASRNGTPEPEPEGRDEDAAQTNGAVPSAGEQRRRTPLRAAAAMAAAGARAAAASPADSGAGSRKPKLEGVEAGVPLAVAIERLVRNQAAIHRMVVGKK